MNFAQPAVPSYSMNSQSNKREERLPVTKRLFEAIDPSVTRSGQKLLPASSQQPQLPTPPELLHDSEEDDEDSLSTPSLSLSPKQSYMKDQQINVRPNHNKNRSYSHSYVRPIISFSQQHRQQQRHRRKSVPYKSPSVVQDPFQASLFDKSIVFQLNVQPHASNNHQSTIISSTTTATTKAAQAHAEAVPLIAKENSRSASSNQTCPDCGDACDFKCTSEVICGQSLLSALRKRVAHARSLQQQQQQQHQEESALLQPRLLRRKRTRAASIIEIPRSHRRSSASSDHSHATTATTTTTSVEDSPSSSNDTSHSHTHPNQDMNNASYHQYGPPSALSTSAPFAYHDHPHHSSSPSSTLMEHSQYPSFYPGQENNHDNEDQHPLKRFKKIPAASRRQSNHGVSSGRPSRVKGPCQACQEASDGCMRKAFDWPFPASQIFNDKGKPFVYLCNKCGLRYNKSGGCVCRHCRWVFCKEEKRKALQHIEVMRRNRPDNYVDPEENIENFVCSPKYWTCGKPWKVGWVLNNIEEDDEEVGTIPPINSNDASMVSSPLSIHV